MDNRRKAMKLVRSWGFSYFCDRRPWGWSLKVNTDLEPQRLIALRALCNKITAPSGRGNRYYDYCRFHFYVTDQVVPKV